MTGRNARGEVVEVQREVEEAIIDDHLPAIADLFAKWLRQGAAHRWMHEMNSPARVERHRRKLLFANSILVRAGFTPKTAG